jgi:hypothetical protein
VWYIARHEFSRGGITRKEALQISRGAVVVAHDEPGKIVEDVMQTGDEQQSIEHTIGKKTERAGTENGVARGIHTALDERPRQPQDRGEHESREPAHDGNEASAAEKAQIARQRDVAAAVIADAGDDAGQEAHRNTEFRQTAGRHRKHRCHATRRDQEADERGQPGGAMILPCESHANADREQQSQIREDGVARGRHGRPSEQVRLPQAQQ